mmetsp:Transcript_49553/g.155239  ORF Transcript_49553/g.155239 Transcript_49553/m.155239 type:complete len:250 (-) Transcript_49553:76-825(-)
MDWENAPEIVQWLRFPATASVIGTCCTIWYLIWRNRLDYVDLGSSYRFVVIEKQWWRTLSASLSHINLVHLGFNMFSTWQLRHAEQILGSLEYLRFTLVFLLLSVIFQNAIHHVLLRTPSAEYTLNTVGVGFSCVVFAWMTWMSLLTSGQSLDFLFFRVPYNMSPFASLIFTQLMIPRVDFIGHLSGIIAGYWQGWGLNAWLDGYWTVQILVLYFVGCVCSLHWSGKEIPFVRVSSEMMSSRPGGMQVV